MIFQLHENFVLPLSKNPSVTLFKGFCNIQNNANSCNTTFSHVMKNLTNLDS